MLVNGNVSNGRGSNGGRKSDRKVVEVVVIRMETTIVKRIRYR